MKKTFLKHKTAILFALAAVLLLASTAGNTQAALAYYSENYSAKVTVSNIGVTLLENGKEVSRRNYLEDGKWDDTNVGTLLANMLDPEGTGTKEALVLGKAYTEEISVKNSGSIDIYVRVILTRSWQDAEGVKDPTLSPELIELATVTTEESGWVIDETASTPERTVLYYTKVLPAYSEENPDAVITTPALTSTLKINPAIGTKFIETKDVRVEDGKTYTDITYEYEYDGYSFAVEAEVDAVQTHNAKDAIKSAWGVDVNVAEDGTISLAAPAVQE